jgi:hypothetical protein
MNHRRVAIAALAAAGLLALGACGDPDSPQPAAQAQPGPRVAAANQRALNAHRNFQRAVEEAAANQRMVDAHRKFQEALVEIAAKDHVAYAPASADQIERRAVAAAEARVQYRPFSADQIERRADAAASHSAAPWWTQKR